MHSSKVIDYCDCYLCIPYMPLVINFCILNDLLKLSVTSTEGMTATCAAAFGLPNLTNWNLRLQLLNLANNKVKQKNGPKH